MSFIAAEKKNFPLEIEKGILSGIQLSITQMAFGHVFFLSFSYSRAVPWSSSFMTRIFLKNVGKLFSRMWCEHFFFFFDIDSSPGFSFSGGKRRRNHVSPQIFVP